MYSRCRSRFVAYFLGHLSRSSFSQFFLVFSTKSFVTTRTDIRRTLLFFCFFILCYPLFPCPYPFPPKEILSASFFLRPFIFLSSSDACSYPLTPSVRSVSSSSLNHLSVSLACFPSSPASCMDGPLASLKSERENGPCCYAADDRVIRAREREKETETTRRATAMIIIRRPNNQCDPPGKEPRTWPCSLAARPLFYYLSFSPQASPHASLSLSLFLPSITQLSVANVWSLICIST